MRDISSAKQEIISYRKIIKPQRPALRLLERSAERFLPEQLELYFDDLVDASERIWDVLDNYKEVVEALESDERAGALAPLQRRPADPHRLQHRVPARDPDHGALGMNIGLPGGGDRQQPRRRCSGSSWAASSP